MNTLKDIIAQHNDFKDFARSYGKRISKLLEELDVDALERIMSGFKDARTKGSTVYIIGNGGSAATAAHMANDLSFGSRQPKDLPLKIVSLTDNQAVLTATANDLNYDQIFLRQLQVYYKPGDRLLVISASGNSSNLITAAQWVKNQGGEVWGFLGFDGGKLKSICDRWIVVKTAPGEYGPVEDIHMILDHLLTAWLYSKVF